MTENKDTASYYTVADAATFKGVSYHTVSRAVRSGRLLANRIGRSALIARTDLETWTPDISRRPKKYDPPRRDENVAPKIVGEVR